MLLHIRILWDLLDSKSIPYDPPRHIIDSFSAKFGSKAQVEALDIQRAHPLVDAESVQLPTSVVEKTGSRIVANHSKVNTSILSYMKACIARFGFTLWRPDLRQNADSLYNSALRIIAIETFQQALVSNVYGLAFKINTVYAADVSLLIKIYNHFVFHYFAGRYRRDSKNPGSVVRMDKKSGPYKLRSDVGFLFGISASV